MPYRNWYESYVFQEGDANGAEVYQYGEENLAVVDQEGDGNYGYIDQWGYSNEAFINQVPGWTPEDNEGYIYQTGNENWAKIDQYNDRNWAMIEQIGDENWALSQQAGNDNWTGIGQYGFDNYAYARVVNGNENQILTIQMGDENIANTHLKAGSDENVVEIWQVGEANMVGDKPYYGDGFFGGADNFGVLIDGDMNSVYVDQFGFNNMAEVNITGNGNSSTIIQAGTGNGPQ